MSRFLLVIGSHLLHVQVQKAIAGLDLPNNPLDELIDRLGGPPRVAEMTGRKGRLVRRKDGEAGVKWEARNASGVDKGSSLEMINILERKMFLSGEKLVAVISEAASAGISLHADRLAPVLLLLSLHTCLQWKFPLVAAAAHRHPDMCAVAAGQEHFCCNSNHSSAEGLLKIVLYNSPRGTWMCQRLLQIAHVCRQSCLQCSDKATCRFQGH